MMHVWHEPEGRIVSVSHGAPMGPMEPPRPGLVLTFTAESVDPETHYASGGAFLPLPARPSRHHAWDAAARQWVDPRTDDDRAQAIDARRAAARLPRNGFLKAAMREGIVTAAEAVALAEGRMPDSLRALIDAMPEDRRADVHIDWLAAADIERTDLLLAARAAGIGLADAQLDALFGVAAD